MFVRSMSLAPGYATHLLRQMIKTLLNLHVTLTSQLIYLRLLLGLVINVREQSRFRAFPPFIAVALTDVRFPRYFNYPIYHQPFRPL